MLGGALSKFFHLGLLQIYWLWKIYIRFHKEKVKQFYLWISQRTLTAVLKNFLASKEGF